MKAKTLLMMAGVAATSIAFLSVGGGNVARASDGGASAARTTLPPEVLGLADRFNLQLGELRGDANRKPCEAEAKKHGRIRDEQVGSSIFDSKAIIHNSCDSKKIKFTIGSHVTQGIKSYDEPDREVSVPAGGDLELGRSRWFGGSRSYTVKGGVYVK